MAMESNSNDCVNESLVFTRMARIQRCIVDNQGIGHCQRGDLQEQGWRGDENICSTDNRVCWLLFKFMQVSQCTKDVAWRTVTFHTQIMDMLFWEPFTHPVLSHQ